MGLVLDFWSTVLFAFLIIVLRNFFHIFARTANLLLIAKDSNFLDLQNVLFSVNKCQC